MTRLYKHSKIGKRILYKIRHHKGHGIHSPFVFRFINNVIEEKNAYYCFPDLRKHLDQFHNHNLKIRKENLLSFRIVNYFNIQTVVEIGSGKGINTLFITAPSSKIACYCFENSEKKKLLSQKIQQNIRTNITYLKHIEEISHTIKPDCVFIDLNRLTQEQILLLGHEIMKLNSSCFIFVRGIRNNKDNLRFWKQLAHHPDRTALLDLFNIGILFFNKQLSRWNYQISF